MKIISLITVLLFCFNFWSQCPYLGPDQELPANTESTTLFADTSNCIEYPKKIIDYDVYEIPYTQIENNGTEVYIGGFVNHAGPINIGFDFSFFEVLLHLSYQYQSVVDHHYSFSFWA